MNKIGMLLIVQALVISGKSVSQDAETNDKKAIEQVVEEFKEAIVTENKEEFMKLFVKEKVSWVGNGSKGAMYDSPEGFMHLLSVFGDCREDFHNLEIRNDEFIGMVTFDYGFFEEDELRNWGKECWVLIKENGQWKITSVNFSMIMPFTKPYPWEY